MVSMESGTKANYLGVKVEVEIGSRNVLFERKERLPEGRGVLPGKDCAGKSVENMSNPSNTFCTVFSDLISLVFCVIKVWFFSSFITNKV